MLLILLPALILLKFDEPSASGYEVERPKGDLEWIRIERFETSLQKINT